MIQNTAGNLTLAKTGAGTFTLSGTGTYTGGTNINAGTLFISGSAALPGSGTVTVAGGAALSTADGTARTTNVGGLNLASGARLVMDWSDQLAATAAATPAGNVILSPNGSFTFGNTYTPLTAGGGLTSGNYLLANNTTYTAALGVSSASLTITPSTATALTTAYWYGGQVTGGSGAMALSTGAASNWSTTQGSLTSTGLVPGSSANVIFSAAGATQEGNIALGANMTLNSLTFNDSVPVTINNDGNTLTILSTGSGTASAISANQNAAINAAVALGASQTWTVAGGATLAVGGPVSGGFGMTLAGGGTLTLSGTNTYSGNTSVSAGTLDLSNGLALQNSTLATGGAGIVFDTSVSSHAFTLGGLGGSASLALQDNSSPAPLAVALTVGGNNAGTTYSGMLSNGGSLTKIGTGTLVLNGSNTYTGGTTVLAGTLQLGDGAVSNGYVQGNILNNATVAFANPTPQTWSNLISGSGSLVKLGAGSLIVNASNTYTGGTTVSAGTLQLGDGALNNGSVPGNIADNAALAFANPNAQTYSGVISGNGSLVKLGATMLTLSGTNTFSGNTSVSAGTLDLTNGLALQNSTLATGGAGIIFDTAVNSHAFTLGGLGGGANLALQDNSSPAPFAVALTVGGNNVSTTYSGMLSGGGSLTKIGTGSTLVLNGSNTYTGATTVSAGTLQLGDVIFNNGSVQGNILDNGAVAFANPTPQTWSNVLSGSGALVKLGNGTLTLNASNTYTGRTTVAGGTLLLNLGNDPTGVLSATSSLTLSGGGLLVNGNSSGASGQTLGNLTVGAGGGSILVNPNGGTGTTVGLGTITATTVGGSLLVGTAPAAGGGATLTTSSGADATGIYGGRVVFTDGSALGYNWAATTSTGAPYTLSAYSGYSALNTAGGSDTNNSRITGGTTMTGNVTTNTLKIENPAASQGLALGSYALTLNSGGLLATGSNAFTISGGTLTGGSNGIGGYDLVVDQYNTGGLTISSTIANNGSNATGLTLSGTGNLTLSAINTYTGNTSINGGTLTMGAIPATTRNVSIASGATFQMNANYAPTVTGNGTWIINSGYSTGYTAGSFAGFAGTTIIGSGTRYAPAPMPTGLMVIAPGGQLWLAGGQYTGNVQIYGYTWANSYGELDGAVRLNGGSTGAGGSLGGTLTLGSNTGVAGGQTGGTGSISANISGAYQLMLMNGTITFSGSNSFGSFNISPTGGATASVAIAGNSTAFGGGGLSVAAGGTAELNGFSLAAGDLSGAGNVQNGGAATAATLTVGSDNTSTSFTGLLSNGGNAALALTKTGTGVLTLSAQNTLTGPVTVNGGGLTATGPNIAGGGAIPTASALFVNSGGTVTVANTNGLCGYGTGGTAAVNLPATVNSGGLLTMGAGLTAHVGALTMAGGTLASADAGLGGDGTFNLDANVAVTANSTISALDVQGWAASLAPTTTFTLASGVTLNVPGYLGNMNNGVSSYTQAGAGLMILAGANTYSGSTTVSGGTLDLANGLALQNSTLATGGTGLILDTSVSGHAFTFGGLSGSASLALQDNTSPAPVPIALAVGTNNASTTYSGILSGGGSLTKIGNGSLTLTNSNTYTGGTTVSAGTLQLGDGVVNNGYVQGNIFDNGTLAFANPAAQSYVNAISGNGSLVKLGAGLLMLGGSNTYSGATTIGGGTLQAGNVSALGAGAGALTVASGGMLDLHGFSFGFSAFSGGGLIDNLAGGAATLTIGNGGGNGTFSGTIQDTFGAVALVKTGSGSQVLSGANTYVGPTTINAGTLQAANSGALGTTPSIAVNNAGSMLALNFGGTSDYTQAGVAALLGKTTFSATTTALGLDTTNAASPATYAGVLSMPAGLTKLGTGTLILAQSNTYTGLTTLTAGMLQLGSSSALPAATTLTITAGTLNLNGNNSTITSFGTTTAGVISDYSAGSGTTTLTLTNDTNGLNSLVTDGLTEKVALVIKNNLDAAGGGGTLNNNYNTFSGGLTLSGAGSTGLRYAMGYPTQVGTPGNLTTSPFGRGPIILGLSTFDKVQLWFTGDNNVNFMSNIVFNSAKARMNRAPCASMPMA